RAVGILPHLVHGPLPPGVVRSGLPFKVGSADGEGPGGRSPFLHERLAVQTAGEEPLPHLLAVTLHRTAAEAHEREPQHRTPGPRAHASRVRGAETAVNLPGARRRLRWRP